MDDLNDTGRNLIPPITPDLVLCGPHLTAIVRSAIDAVAAGMDPDEAASQIGSQMYAVFVSRIDNFHLHNLTSHARFDPGRDN